MKDDHIEELCRGIETSDDNLNMLSNLTRKIIHNRGKVTKSDLEQFYSVGYDSTEVIAVVLGIAIKTMSNYTNSCLLYTSPSPRDS